MEENNGNETAKRLFSKYKRARVELINKVWRVIGRAEGLEDFEDVSSDDMDLLRQSYPETGLVGWDIRFIEIASGVIARFEREEPWEDWTESAEVRLPWSTLDMPDKELNAWLVAEATKLGEEALMKAEVELRTLAAELGRTVI